MLGIGQVPLEIGSKIQGYEIIRTLGAGGFGIVYEGYNPVLDRKVAIKEFFPVGYATREDATDILNVGDQHHKIFEKVLRKFRDTSGYLAKLDHPTIVKVHGYHDEPTTAYMLMDFVEGETLRNWRASKGGSFSASDFRNVFGPVLDALDYMHAQKMYHRDLSPENILVDANDNPTIIDFGAVKHELWESQSNDQAGAASTLVVAREAYAPPEQLQLFSAPIGAYTDIFSLASVMYEILCNTRPPIAGERVGAKAMGTENPYVPVGDQSKIKLSPKEFQAIDRALELRPDERFTSIREFANAAGWDKYLNGPNMEEPVTENSDTEEPNPEVPETEENAADVRVDNHPEKQDAPKTFLHQSWDTTAVDKPKKKSLLPYGLIAASVAIGIIALAWINSSRTGGDSTSINSLSQNSAGAKTTPLAGCNSLIKFLEVKKSGNLDQLSTFLQSCKETDIYLSRANALENEWRGNQIKAQQTQTSEAIERIKYTTALNAGSNAIPLLENYLKEYPNGGFSKLAQHELDRLQSALNTQKSQDLQGSQDRETQTWQAVTSNPTIQNIFDYYEQYPNGQFVSNAESILADHANYFVNGFYQTDPQSNNSVRNFAKSVYAYNVLFYRKQYTLDQIIEDRTRLYSRWPVRTYIPDANKMRANCDLGSKICEVTTAVYFEVYSPERDERNSGNQTTIFVIKMSVTGNKILGESIQ